MKNVKVGDEVNYLPDKIHAFEQDAQGNYGWVMGLNRPIAQTNAQGRIEMQSQVSEIDSKGIRDFFKILGLHPNPNEEMKRLVLIRPYRPWKALVRSVNKDGSCDLDITAARSGITLNYNGIPYDSTKSKPHSFHLKEE